MLSPATVKSWINSRSGGREKTTIMKKLTFKKGVQILQDSAIYDWGAMSPDGEEAHKIHLSKKGDYVLCKSKQLQKGGDANPYNTSFHLFKNKEEADAHTYPHGWEKDVDFYKRLGVEIH